jgi:hypothetical protein
MTMAALGDALAARIIAIAATKPAKWKIRMEYSHRCLRGPQPIANRADRLDGHQIEQTTSTNVTDATMKVPIPSDMSCPKANCERSAAFIVNATPEHGEK